MIIEIGLDEIMNKVIVFQEKAIKDMFLCIIF